MQSNDDRAEHRAQRKSLLFFAPDTDNTFILAAYEMYLGYLADSDRYTITVMAPNHVPFAQRARELGFQVHPVSDFSRKLLHRTPQLWPILTATRRYRYDIALSHAAYACRGLSQIAKKVIGVCHDDNFEGFAAAHEVIALTSGASDIAQDVLGDEANVRIMPYPHSCQHREPVPMPESDKALTIGTTGPFIEGDGLGTFLHAAQLLNQSCPDVRFVIAGTGPTEHDLKDLAVQIAPFVDFPGPTTMGELAEEIDLFCLTSPDAPYSTSLCAMMDAGVACVSTCANGPMDILKGGMVAPLVPINDAFMLAVQLQELVEDRPQIERIKKACFERIREEDFHPDTFRAHLDDVLGQ